jgi:hypothetical protein
MTARHRGFPDDVLFRAELEGQILFVGDAGGIRPAELRPVGGPNEGSSEQEEKKAQGGGGSHGLNVRR